MKKPYPGSPEARAQGCICPVVDNEHGEGLSLTSFLVNQGCPLHWGPHMERQVAPTAQQVTSCERGAPVVELLTEERLKEIEKRCSAATPGPYEPVWEYCDCGGDYPCGHPDYIHALKLPTPMHGTKGDHSIDFHYSEMCTFSPETVLLFAHTRTDVPDLAATVRAQMAQIAKMRAALQGLRNIMAGSEGVAGWHKNGDIATWEQLGYPAEIDEALEK